MDLGIRGRRAIAGGANRGLGRSCARALAAEGASLAIVARTDVDLQKTAEEIRKSAGVEVVTVAADLSAAEGRAKVLAAFPDPDILVNNAGGPPTGDMCAWLCSSRTGYFTGQNVLLDGSLYPGTF